MSKKILMQDLRVSKTSYKYLVSAIVSVYNSSQFIREKLDDLIKQTIFSEMEIIIVISGSQENEEELIGPYLDLYSNIKLIKTEKRETIYKAWNRAIKIAEGEFITNSNTDDRLKETAYERLAEFLINNPNVGLAYSDQYLSYVPNESYYQAKLKGEICYIPKFDRLLQIDMALIGSQPMWRARFHFENEIWFDEEFEVSGDHDFELKLALLADIRKYPEVLGTFYRSKKTNKSYENMTRNRAELQKIRDKYIREYCKSFTEYECQQYISSFEWLIKIPILLFLLISKLNRFFYPKAPMFSLEFVYLFMSHCYLKLGNIEKAKKKCNKFLKWNGNRNINSLLQELTN